MSEVPSDEWYYRKGFGRGCIIGVIVGAGVMPILCALADVLFRAAVISLFNSALQVLEFLGG